MQKVSGFYRKIIGSIVVLATFASAIVLPTRLDLYDASDNQLMYITFEYEAGVNVGRTLYMADGTFIRHTVINRNGDGSRANEVSLNFNEDTSFVLSYQQGATASEFRIVDQFRMDQIGGSVSYSTADNLSYDLTFQKTGELASKMSYEKDGDGNLARVSVFDKTATLQYYGVFQNDEIGVKRPNVRGSESPQVSLHPRGAGRIELQLNLKSAGAVRCDLVTLSGRTAGTLLSGTMKAGTQKVRLRLDGKGFSHVAGGVYILSVSVDGVTVVRSRYLHQNSTVGGGR